MRSDIPSGYFRPERGDISHQWVEDDLDKTISRIDRDFVEEYTGEVGEGLRLQTGLHEDQKTRLDGQDQPGGRTEGMRICDLSIAEAEEFLKEHERHYKAPVEPICAIGVRDETYKLHGAAILGRRERETAELAHIYVDGASQGYSLLYGACWRALKALGYEKAVL